jgi:hypothetical protein
MDDAKEALGESVVIGCCNSALEDWGVNRGRAPGGGPLFSGGGAGPRCVGFDFEHDQAHGLGRA